MSICWDFYALVGSIDMSVVIGLLKILTESHKIYDNMHGIGYIIWGNIMYEHYKYAM